MIDVVFPVDFDQVHFAPVILDVALRYCVGAGVDLGCGDSLFPGAVPVDTGGFYGAVPGYPTADMRDLSSFPGLDYVFSSHALEHVPEWGSVLGGSYMALRPGGVIFLYLPWDEYFATWVPPGAGHVASFSPAVIRRALLRVGFVGLEGCKDEDGPDVYASFWVVGRKP